MHTLEFRILGPLEAVRDGSVVSLPRPKQRALLADMLLHANEILPAERLIDDLWGADPPRTALAALRGLVADLRRLLAADLIETRSRGYVLRLLPASLDLSRFEDLFDEGTRARAAGDLERASTLLREALALWRGRALADVRLEPYANPAIARLEDLRLACTEERIEADLALGRHVELLGELESLVAEHPLRERPRGQLMLVLYRNGRQAEALDIYRDARRVLAQQLGIDPSPQLQRLERAILDQEAWLELPDLDRPGLPSGTVTMLFTDIEGSTELIHELGDRYGEVVAEHRRMLRDAVAGHSGVEVDTQGDAHFCVFAHAHEAAGAAADAQRAFSRTEWPAGTELRVRMGIHTGEPTRVDWGYVGVDVHRASRICSAAHGGQILLSSSTAQQLGAIRFSDGSSIRDLGRYRLKGIPEPESLAQLDVDGLPSEFPPPRLPDAGAGVPEVAPRRSILVVPEQPASELPLLGIAESLAGSRIAPHELIINRLVPPPGSTLREETRALAELRAALLARRVSSRTAAYVSRDRVRDIVRMATEQNVDLLLTECPASLLDGVPSDDLRRLLDEAPCDVALLVARSTATSGPEQPVLVPFGGADHDWAALELAAWAASSTSASLVLAGISDGERDASRLLAVASLTVQSLLGVSAEPLLVSPGAQGLLEAATSAGLVVLPLPSEWRQDGLRQVRRILAREAPVPVLIVRRGLRPGGLAPPEGSTRFTWTIGRGDS